MRSITAVLVAAGLLVPAAVPAQRPAGLWLNGHLNASTFQSEGLPEPETGGGMGFGIGWAFTPGVMLFMHLDGATMPGATSDANYALAHADLGFRLSAGLGSWSPYLLLAGTTRVASWEDVPADGPFGPIYYDMTLSGLGGSAGLGLQKMIGRKLALDAAVIYTKGRFTDREVDERPVVFETYEAETGRLVLGLSWYSRAGR
ncbi:MAG TPA: outer membrane beta-barrel protein [Longimicrobiales bacterium]